MSAAHSPKALVLGAIDKAIGISQEAVGGHVDRVRSKRPGAPPEEIISALEKQYLALVVGTGAAVGGAAAAPGVGTYVALALSAGETLTFLQASTLFALAVAEVHGVRIDDIERRRMLLLAIILGDSGASLVEKAAGRTGKHWGKLLTDAIPNSSILRINGVLGRWFVTKYGTRQGIIVIGRVAPFGIGAVIGGGGNLVVGRGVIAGARRAFGPAAGSVDPDPTGGAHGAEVHRRPDASDGPYGPLSDLLDATAKDFVEMSLDDIHLIVRGGLPPLAWKHKAWWGNERGGQGPQTDAWLESGYEVDVLDLGVGTVTFRRVAAHAAP